MKLRNKQTGEIGEIGYIGSSSGKLTVSPINGVACESIASYNSLAELNEEWEDYEEPKTFWYMTAWGDVKEYSQDQFAVKQKQAIGNYFETKEEAELAVRKLKAWKRLKDKGFSIYSWDYEFDMVDKPSQTIILRASAVDSSNTDLDLLFGGGE